MGTQAYDLLFLISPPKYWKSPKIALKVKDQGQMSPKSNHFSGSTQHTFLPSYIDI